MKKYLLIIAILSVNIIFCKTKIEKSNLDSSVVNQETKELRQTIYFIHGNMPPFNGDFQGTFSFNYSFTHGFITNAQYWLTDYNTPVSIFEIDRVVDADGNIIEGRALRKRYYIITSILNIIVGGLFIFSYL